MNRKNVMTLVMLAGLGTSAFAVGFLGSPTADLGQGKWSIGYDYSYSSQDTDRVTGKNDVPATFKFELKDLNIQRHYAVLGYGLTSSWDIYAKLGIADAKSGAFDSTNNFTYNGMNFDNDFAWGWGTRYTFFRQDSIVWGVALQMNWLDTEWSGPAENVDIDTYDLIVSVGPTFDLGGLKIYGGPYYYYLNGDFDYKEVGYKEKSDIKADRNWGGFIGSVIDLGQNCKWTVEYNTTGKGWGVGTGIAWSF